LKTRAVVNGKPHLFWGLLKQQRFTNSKGFHSLKNVKPSNGVNRSNHTTGTSIDHDAIVNDVLENYFGVQTASVPVSNVVSIASAHSVNVEEVSRPDENDRPEFLTEFERGIADQFDIMNIGSSLQMETAYFIRVATLQRMKRILLGEEPEFQNTRSAFA
jgi:hypothetical protein